ncbi:MAG: hypothetical protein V1853_05075 [bacterium]
MPNKSNKKKLGKYFQILTVKQVRILISVGLIGGLGLIVFFNISYQSQLSRAAGPSTPIKRLSIYDGSLLIDSTAQLRLGNAGRDIQSGGRIYLRPDGSSRGSFIEGSPDSIGQRLELTGGITGQHTLDATWAGTADTDSTLGASTGYFHGGIEDAVGSAIKGEVSDCGALMTCYAGYFSGNKYVGVQAISNTSDVLEPALKASNNNPNGIAGSFEGKVLADTVRAVGNTRGACEWEFFNAEDELICSNNRLLAGIASDTEPDPSVFKLYCCEL